MKLADELACVELVTLVTDYLEGGLTPRDRERFEQHIVFCDGCASYLDQLRTAIEAAGRLQEEDFPPDSMARLLDVFRDWRRA